MNSAKSEFRQGDVVWAQYPLTDKIDKLKRRPALIVSNHKSNNLDDDYIVIPITSTIRHEPFSLTIEPSDVTGDLPVASELRCNKPFTIRKLLFFERIGTLSTNKLEEAILLLSKSVLLYRQVDPATVDFG